MIDITYCVAECANAEKCLYHCSHIFTHRSDYSFADRSNVCEDYKPKGEDDDEK